ncbi:hypothetical protein C100_08035 [Sphingobium sp. C100]|uniref:hypothetical protein n=1 Tax=Sphingobium sp. C100 TaxID=1207055 RepID=UPI0003D67610|nr:hypothetical protein [Sphingobium sp. C100]ETI64312.1 hypothetical protein C100_08035 [Sphingobium sp. C100]
MVKLSAQLAEEGRHPELVKAIARAAAAGSIREDLRAALASLRLVEKMQGEASRESVRDMSDETTVTGALFTQAIILYARATFTTGKRPGLLGESGLSEEDRATHDEVKLLRNSAIGHFGRGDDLQDGPLVREAVILSFTRGQKQLGVYTVRAQHKAQLSARLCHLIEVRLRQIADRQDALFDTVHSLFSQAVQQDAKLGPSLPQFQFDIEAFCASPDAAQRLYAQLEAGQIEDMDYVVSIPKHQP